MLHSQMLACKAYASPNSMTPVVLYKPKALYTCHDPTALTYESGSRYPEGIIAG